MSTTDFKPRLRGIAKLILKLLTQLASLFTNRIKDPEIKMMANGLLNSASQTVDALSDADPDDADQLRGIFNGLVSSGDFKIGAEAELLGNIQKIGNENVRKSLSIINGHTFPIADLLTDQNKKDTEQVREYMVQILSSNDGIELFNALLGIILPASYADTLTVLIIQALMNELEGDERENATIAVARLITLQNRFEKQVA